MYATNQFIDAGAYVVAFDAVLNFATSQRVIARSSARCPASRSGLVLSHFHVLMITVYPKARSILVDEDATATRPAFREFSGTPEIIMAKESAHDR